MKGFGKAAFSALLLAGVSSLPLQADAQTLEEALSAAYANNPTLQAQRAALRAVDEGLPQARSGWRPTVTLLGDLGKKRIKSDTSTVDADWDTRTTYSGTLQVTQNLYAGGGTEAGVAKAESDILSQRSRLRSTEQTILLRAATAYLDVYRDSAVLELNIQNEARLAKQLEATRDRFEVGEVTRTDVAQAESRVSRARADRISAQGALETSRAVYEQIVGEQPKDLAKPDFAVNLPTSRDEAVTLATDRNPDVAASVYDRESALHQVRAQVADLLPSVDLTGSASRARNKSGNDTTVDDMTIEASVSIPVYQAGFETSQVRQAKQTVAQSSKQIEEARRTSIESATSSWEDYQTALAEIRAYEEEVRATTIALEGVQQEASVGSRTVLDVLDAQQELLNANVSLVRSQRDELVAQFGLLAAVGGLTAKEIGLGIDYYDETDHYNRVKDKWWGLGDDLPKYE